MDTSSPNSKIVFRVEHPDGSVNVETPWATALGNDLYRLENSPFYAYGVSWLDVIYAPYDPDEKRPVFRSISAKSGHRTVRAIFDPPVEDGNSSSEILESIVAIGASYEGATKSFIAIDIPPSVELNAICNALTKANVKWEHADPRYEDIHGNDD